MKIFIAVLLVSVAWAEETSEILQKNEIPIYGPNFDTVIPDVYGHPQFRKFPLSGLTFQDIVDKPTIVLAKVKPENKYTFYAAVDGLNNLQKYTTTQPLQEYLSKSDNTFAVVYPKNSFPMNKFSDVSTTITVPEHQSSLDKMFSEQYVVAFIPKDQLENFNSVSKLNANFEIDRGNIRISRSTSMIEPIDERPTGRSMYSSPSFFDYFYRNPSFNNPPSPPPFYSYAHPMQNNYPHSDFGMS